MAETKMQLADWLDDLCVRFIVNLPQEELESAERICFQVEEAQWFYEDFIRPLDSSLPSMSLRTFCMAIFRVCPLLSSFSAEQHLAAYTQFLGYKTRVPVRGAILLNEKMDHVLLVKGWKKGASWSFPRGKINKDEKDLDCAIREVYEETGFDLTSAGLVPNEDAVKSIEITMREQHMKLYVFKDVPMDTVFQARTRKEISKIDWWKLSHLPGYQKKKKQTQNVDDSGDSLKANKLYMVAPFLSQLKKWIAEQRRLGNHRRNVSDAYLSTGEQPVTDVDAIIEDDLTFNVPTHNLAPMVYGLSTALPQMVSKSSAGSLPHGVPADAATQMKRLLGVTGSTEVQHQPPTQANETPRHQASLLDLLRQSRQPSHSNSVGRQPALHESKNSRMPGSDKSPYNDQTSLEPSQMQPSFPYTSKQADPNAQLNQNVNLFEAGALEPQMATTIPTHDSGTPSAEQRLHPQSTSTGSGAISNARPIESSNPVGQVSFLHPRAGYLNLAMHDQRASQQIHTIPKESDLSTPKLSSHAVNLLNMFKGVAAPNVESTKPTTLNDNDDKYIDRAGRECRTVDAQPSYGPEGGTLRPQSSQASSKPAFGGLIPSTVSAATTNTSSKGSASLRKATQGNTNQQKLLHLLRNAPITIEEKSPEKSMISPDQSFSNSTQDPHTERTAALLGLFKGQPVQKPVSKADWAPPEQESTTFEDANSPLQLLSKPSVPEPYAKGPEADGPSVQVNIQQGQKPLTASGSGQQQSLPENSMPVAKDNEKNASPQTSTRILQRPSRTPDVSAESKKSPATNVFARPSVPDHEITARKKKQIPKTALQKAEKKQQTPTTPIQILKRPASSSVEKRAPQLSLHEGEGLSNAQVIGSSGTLQKKFTPQILRRPQKASDARHDETRNKAGQDHDRQRTRDEHQRTLVSLLGGSSIAPTQKPSPTTVRDSRPSSVPSSPGVKMKLSRSRMSSITSPPGPEMPVRSRLNSGASTVQVSTPLRESMDTTGSQTPISPADKGFLVNYLEGVIGKSGAK